MAEKALIARPTPVAGPRTTPPAEARRSTVVNDVAGVDAQAIGSCGIQRNQAVGASDDPLEREADAVANRVMAMRDGPAVAHAATSMQSTPAHYGHLPAGDGTPRPMRDMLASAGRPLESGLRRDMETRFAHDFSAVRVHSDPSAAQSAQAIEARAYTCGSHIAFGTGMFAPVTAAGRRLLAHELTHVVQQGGAGRLADRGHVAPQISVETHPALLRRDPTPVGLKATVPETPLPAGQLIDQALSRLEEPDFVWMRQLIAPVDGLWKELVEQAATSNDGQSDKLRARVDRVNSALMEMAPAIIALHQLDDPQKYLPGVASKIIDRTHLVLGMYAAALVSVYSDLLIDRNPLKQANAELLALPDFITQQYLSPQGLQVQLAEIHKGIFNIQELRGAAGRPVIARTNNGMGPRRMDDILQLTFPSTQRSKFAFDDELTAARASKVAADINRHMGLVAIAAEGYGNLVKAGLLYEQFAYWSSLLDKHPLLDHFPSRKAECDAFAARLDPIIRDIESAWSLTGDAFTVYTSGAGNLATLMASPELAKVLVDVPERLKAIETINRIATVIAITAGAALTSGVAAAGVGAALETAGVGTLLVGAGELATEALAFTAASRLGQQAAFGQVEGTFEGDLLTNALMFSVLKVAALGYTSAFRLLADPKVYKVSYAIGKAGVGLATLQIFGEVQSAILTGKMMSGEERYRSVVQNVITLGALEAAGFITRPIQERIGVDLAKEFGLDKRFAADLVTLQTKQAGLAKAFEALKRSGNPDPKGVNELLDGMQDLWAKELDLLKRGRQRHAISPEQYDAALKAYGDIGARLQLQLANLGFELPGGAGDLTFRRLGTGVVSFAEGGEAVIERFYKDKGGKFERNADGTLQGRLPTGEITFYIPAGEAPPRIASKETIASARDNAERAARGDALSRAGLDRLRELMSARNVDDVLAEAKDVAALLHALADPAFDHTLGVPFYTALAGKPFAIEFARRYGARLLVSVYRTYGRNLSLMPDVLAKASQQLDVAKATSPEAARSLADQMTNAASRAKLEALLGTPVTEPPAKPARVTRKTLGVSRATSQWKTLRGEADKFATLHDEKLTDDQLDARADAAQIQALARQGKYANFSHANRQAILDRVDELSRDGAVDQVIANGRRGDVAEALFNPDYQKKDRIFLLGVEQKTKVADSTVPDYGLAHGSLTEWVELKSDVIDRGTIQKDGAFDSGVAAAGKYLREARADMPNLPPGDRLSLDFIRDPGPITRQRMLDILFVADSPLSRVRFGGAEWVEKVGYIASRGAKK